MRNDDNDFFRNFWRAGAMWGALAVVGNLVVWGGLIWFACWAIKHFFLS